MGIVETGYHRFAMAVDYSRSGPRYRFQFVIAADQSNLVTRNSHKLSRWLPGIHSYNIGVSEDDIGGWHKISFDGVFISQYTIDNSALQRRRR